MKPILNLLLCWLFCVPVAMAQTKVQVVTKTARQELDAQDKPVIIRLNKSKVNLTETTGENVEVIWRIITKNSDRTVAESETDFIDYSLRRNASEVTIDYDLKIPRGYGKLKSSLEIEVDIKVPKNVALKLITQLTNTETYGIDNQISAELKFGSLKLVNYRGKLSLKSSFGDVECQNCGGAINASLEKAAFFAGNLSAKTTVTSRFGEVKIQPTNNAEIKVDAYRSPVSFSIQNPENFAWNCENKFAEINVPESYKKHITTYLNDHLFDLNKASGKPKISVTNQYEPIVIDNQPISLTNK